jgi:transcriptional regulator GlxA family with amidase domain
MDHRVTHIIECMRERLHGELTLEALAAEVGISASRLGFLFRHETGRSPGAYLQALRMERARLLLESTDLSVREVMQQVGLSDPSHFSRDFRNAHGLSPRSYRLQLRLAGPPVRYILGNRVVAHAHDLHTNRSSGPATAMRSGEHELNKKEK